MAFFVAEFVPYLPECTGQFVGVGGRWTMLAVTNPFVLGSNRPDRLRVGGARDAHIHERPCRAPVLGYGRNAALRGVTPIAIMSCRCRCLAVRPASSAKCRSP